MGNGIALLIIVIALMIPIGIECHEVNKKADEADRKKRL